MDITDPSKNYSISHPANATFMMKHFTMAMQEIVDRECLIQEGNGYRWDITREREIKIEQCLIGWDGINFEGSPLPFSVENSKKLPVGIVIWLVKDIDEKAGVRMAEAEKKS